MENKTIILKFKNEGWQKVKCKDFKMHFNIYDKLIKISWEECEGHTIPYYLDVNEVIAIFPVNNKE
ncbi:MAG: hypothetical protein PHT02_00500 [Tissierellia bacterium]|nr:hypothetical protein [Tissierellia bacterium]